MHWTVDLHLIDTWLLELDETSYERVIAALELLAERGPQLGRPLVDTVVGSRHKNMKELRPGSSGRSELRILFCFDPERSAILLVAGDKSGNWRGWYRSGIPEADTLFDQHLEQTRTQGADIMKTIEQIFADRPVDRARVDARKKQLLDEIRAYKLRELREAAQLTQVELAHRLDVSQNRVSRIEHGEIERTQVDTLRKYVEAVGGDLRVEVEFGDERIRIA